MNSKTNIINVWCGDGGELTPIYTSQVNLMVKKFPPFCIATEGIPRSVFPC